MSGDKNRKPMNPIDPIPPDVKEIQTKRTPELTLWYCVHYPEVNSGKLKYMVKD